jgi:RNA polymerase sigma factor (sigma-70 family)
LSKKLNNYKKGFIMQLDPNEAVPDKKSADVSDDTCFSPFISADTASSDIQLWQGLKRGDLGAASQLMRNYYNVLYRYGIKFSGNDSDLVKDCIQELFIKLWDNRDRLTDVQVVKPYLITALRRRLLDSLRQRSGLQPLPGFFSDNEFHSIAAFSYSPEDFIIREQEAESRSQKISQALNQLTKRQREAIYLRFFENMEYKKIAAAMDLKERTVYNLVHEGLNNLRTSLKLFISITLLALLFLLLF